MSKPFYPRLDRDEFIDEIRITTVPRFKTSGLSGDEWRTSTQVVALRKGLVVGERSWGRIKDAVPRLQRWLEDELLSPIADPDMTEHLCFQPGCVEPWTVEYRIVKRGCSGCGSVKDEDADFFDYRRRFCERHARRGDSNLDDSDDFYGPVDGGQPPAEQMVRAEDESPSVFGGVIKLGE